MRYLKSQVEFDPVTNMYRLITTVEHKVDGVVVVTVDTSDWMDEDHLVTYTTDMLTTFADT